MPELLSSCLSRAELSQTQQAQEAMGEKTLGFFSCTGINGVNLQAA